MLKPQALCVETSQHLGDRLFDRVPAGVDDMVLVGAECKGSRNLV